MTPIQLNDKEVLIVDVPEMTGTMTLRNNPSCNSSLSFFNVMDNNQEVCIVLPSGDWTLIGITPLTEDQADLLGMPLMTWEHELTAHNIPAGRKAVLVREKK